MQEKPSSLSICSTAPCVVEPVETPMVWPSRSSMLVQPFAFFTMIPTESVRYGVEKSQLSSRSGVMVYVAATMSSAPESMSVPRVLGVTVVKSQSPCSLASSYVVPSTAAAIW